MNPVEVIERTYDLEFRGNLLGTRLSEYETLYAEKLKVVNHRIEGLEKEGSA